MRRALSAYLAGVAAGGCVVKEVRPYVAKWLRELGYVKDGVVELPRRYCRLSPTSLIEHVYFLKGAFETYGEFFAGDPHRGDVVAIFKVGSRKVAKSLKLLGIDPLETTDEAGASRYVVVYRRRDVRRFVKVVKPVVDDVHVARLLGLCGRW
ncbi:MAG: hypothetical protein QXP31_06185 [Pyrobaculum sp.]